MILLILGLALWWATHLFAIVAPARRAALTAKMGEGPSKGLLALATIASIVLMVFGYQNAEVVNLWYPVIALTHANNALMLVAVFLFIAGSIPSPVRRKVRHPQLAGTKVWALAHLLVNGDLASVVLFGGILAWAVVAMIFTNRRDGPREELPPVEKRGWIVHIAATAIVFAVIVWIHGGLLGVWPLPG